MKNEEVMKLAGEMKREREEAREKEEILFELHEGRVREAERRKEAIELELEIRKRLAFKESNEAAAEFRARLKERAAAEEEELRQSWVAEMEEKEKLEQMSDQKRRMKKLVSGS